MPAIELHEDSIAGIILDAKLLPQAARSGLGRPLMLPSGSAAAIILGEVPTHSGPLLAVALVAAAALHVGLAVGALASRLEFADKTNTPAAKKPLQIDRVVDLDPPAPPAPAPPATVQPPVATRAPRPTAPSPTEPSDSPPPPPAESAQVVAVDDNANQPLDFTGFEISTGQGQRYAGGITASSGANTQAVHTPHVDRNAAPNLPHGDGPSRARPVGLPARDWRCPWPAEADALSIDEQVVVIRVVVRVDGAVASAELISDPGYGFGQVALDCARQHRFPPAAGVDGRAITATSPPIRVRFTRP